MAFPVVSSWACDTKEKMGFVGFSKETLCWHSAESMQGWEGRSVCGMGEAGGFKMHLLSTPLRSGHLEWTDRMFRIRQQGTLHWPVYVWERNTNELHGHAREQLPCYSTNGPKVVYKGKEILYRHRSVALDLCSLREVRWFIKRSRRTGRQDASYSTNLSLPGLLIHQGVFVYGVPKAASSSSIAQLPAVLDCSTTLRHLASLPMLFPHRMCD